MWTVFKSILFIYFCRTLCSCEIHNLHIKNNTHRYMHLSTFGYYTGGKLEVALVNFNSIPENSRDLFGFSLVKTSVDNLNFYLGEYQSYCVLENGTKSNIGDTVILFKLHLDSKLLTTVCEKPSAHIYKDNFELEGTSKFPTDSFCSNFHFEIESVSKNGHIYYNTSFAMTVDNKEEEGLYYLFFHSCPNYNLDSKNSVDFIVKIAEQNPNSYLSVDDIPLPAIYCISSIVFLLTGMFWILVLRQSRHRVLKIHHLMSYLVLLKTLSLALHGIDYYYVDRLGVHLVTWRVSFYVAEVFMNILFATVLVLVGSGWNVIKVNMTRRDKWMLGYILLLKISSELVETFLEESTSSPMKHMGWRTLFVILEFACFFFLLFPTIWTIRYLRNILKVNFEVADNEKRYRYFYITIVFYIYLTTVIAYLLNTCVPFGYGWVENFFCILTTYIFFVLTGFMFRPSSLGIECNNFDSVII